MYFESEDFKEIVSHIRENEIKTPYFICSCKFSDDEKDSITYVTDRLVVSDMIDDANSRKAIVCLYFFRIQFIILYSHI